MHFRLLPLLVIFFSVTSACGTTTEDKETASDTTEESTTTEASPSTKRNPLEAFQSVSTEGAITSATDTPTSAQTRLSSSTQTLTAPTPPTSQSPTTQTSTTIKQTTTTVLYYGGKLADPNKRYGIIGREIPPQPCLETDVRAFEESQSYHNRVVDNLFYNCLWRPTSIYDDNIWVQKLKTGTSPEEVRSLINSSAEAQCMRGTYECGDTKIDAYFRCNFSTAVAQHKNQQIRLNSYCPDVKVTIK